MERCCQEIQHQPFLYPVFGRFVYILSALYGHCKSNIRTEQTACTQTAGHWISEMADVIFPDSTFPPCVENTNKTECQWSCFSICRIHLFIRIFTVWRDDSKRLG